MKLLSPHAFVKKVSGLIQSLKPSHSWRLEVSAAFSRRVQPKVVSPLVEESNLAHNISLLREALQKRQGHIRYIEAVSERGYRFVAEFSLLGDEDAAISSGSHTRRLRGTGRRYDLSRTRSR